MRARQNGQQSHRADGRGHWPAGRRRNKTDAKIRLRLLAAIRRCLRAPSPNPNRPGRTMSRKEIAVLAGVSDKTITRWYAGEHHPRRDTALEAIRALNAAARRAR